MRLVIDNGNTLTKVVLLRGMEPVRSLSCEQLSLSQIESICDDIYEVEGEILKINGVIFSQVRKIDDDVVAYLKNRYDYVIDLNYTTPIPIKNMYETPETLGTDRLAAAIGAYTVFPKNSVMVVDFGSAITIDIIVKNKYLGGNISPGVEMRFKALHEHTQNLPKVELVSKNTIVGTNTTEAIQNGVINGIVSEIRFYIEYFNAKYKNLEIIFTGGDGKYFADKFKNTIFVVPELVLRGLNEVLNYNAAEKQDI